MVKATDVHQDVYLLGGDLPVHQLGFGAMRVTGPGIWGPPKNLVEAHAVLKKVVELGINFIDTADAYGPEVSENLIAETLFPYPADLVIATKGGLTRGGPDQWTPNGRPEYLRACVEKSLKRLKLQCIDLYQLHRIDPSVPVEESLGALLDMQKQGKIRHIGLSEVSVAEIERAEKIVKIVSVQNLYNLSNRKAEGVLDYCEKHHMAFIPWYPLASGDLGQLGKAVASIAEQKHATRAQIALAWMLRRSLCILPIPGTSSVAQLEENFAATKIQLTDEEFDQLTQLQ